MISLARRRARCDELAIRFYPLARRREHRMREAVAEHLQEGGAFLDAGSGPWFGMARHFVSRARLSIAMDRVPLRAAMLDRGARAVYGDLRELPFRDEAFDVITLRSVLEHLEDPVAVLRGCRRILRPGGRIIALAPSRWYFACVARGLMPERASHALLRWIFGQTVHDDFPVYYRANTPRAVARAARAAGLRLESALACPHPPAYLKFSPLLFRLGVVYDRLAGLWPATRVLQASFLYILGKA